MADRRMMTKRVTDDDNFLSLSSSAQALYLHLSMNADDDGFCNQISTSMFKAHASIQDLQALLEKRYLYQFANGVIVIKHWRMANALRKDRYTPTNFQEELHQLRLKDNGAYTLVDNWLPDGCQVVAERLPQDRIDKDSVDKSNNNTQKSKLFALVDSYSDDETITNLLYDWMDIRKAKRSAQTEKAIKQNLDRLADYAKESKMSLSEYLSEVVRRGWAAFYPIKNFEKAEPKQETSASYDLNEFEERSLHGELKYERKKK
jgi:hypothetical protein